MTAISSSAQLDAKFRRATRVAAVRDITESLVPDESLFPLAQ